MWPFSRAAARKPAAPTVTIQEIESGLAALFGNGADFSLFYANMNGYLRETIEAAQDYMAAVEAEPSFSPVGIEFAVAHATKDVDVLCKQANLFLLLPSEAEREVGPLQAAVRASSAADVFRNAGFDLSHWLQSVSIQRRAADLELLAAIFEGRKLHLRPLLVRAKAAGKNKYGDLDLTKYVAEISEFLAYACPQGTLKFFYTYPPLRLCLDYVAAWTAESFDTQAIPTDGIDFEHWCAAQIEKQGWTVRVSKASGDQGIDIEALRPGLTVAIQCKRYAEPIGNKAVQEAAAGTAHYRANLGCVIGTGGYTRSAVELAGSTGVVLLDAENIDQFTEIVTERIGS